MRYFCRLGKLQPNNPSLRPSKKLQVFPVEYRQLTWQAQSKLLYRMTTIVWLSHVSGSLKDKQHTSLRTHATAQTSHWPCVPSVHGGVANSEKLTAEASQTRHLQ